MLALWRAAAGLAAVEEFCLYCCSVTYALFLIRNSGVLDSGGGVLAKASPPYSAERDERDRTIEAEQPPVVLVLTVRFMPPAVTPSEFSLVPFSPATSQTGG
jgi:hypothetical protein